jgi:hypothetical protein
MTPVDKYTTYRDKCKQHLHRAALGRTLALGQVGLPAVLVQHKKLVEQSLDEGHPDPVTALKAAINKTHFLLLKVEFEHFLKRMAHTAVNQHFPALRRQGKLTAAATESEVDALIPRYGLPALEQFLETTTDIVLANLFLGGHEADWCQIRSAFQVRHLIEHTNGRVDQLFKTKVISGTDWTNSTWATLHLRVKDKIPIRDEDFRKTFDAMIYAADLIAELLEGFSP